MIAPLLETKLFIPQVRLGAVPRVRLSALLTWRGGHVNLISAPAGFGKTTLLAAALADSSRGTGQEATRSVDAVATHDLASVAWVSLDQGDRDPATFWSYVLTALERAAPGVGTGALSSLQSGRRPSTALLGEVLNELSVRAEGVVLVLDDYHLADGSGIEEAMSFLVDHLPPQLCLMLSSRADPLLPLGRLRGRGQLTELRAADLRFSPTEAATYLRQATASDLSGADIDVLEERTEGWIAALQLAALSLRDRIDPSEFIAEFAGDDRFVVDYLVEEVLDRQPESVRTFLLQTSILDRLTGPLCDAVTAATGGRAMLERLDRDNLFLVALDDRRRWYRYHHLFNDLLRSYLADEAQQDVAALHRRASGWYHRAGQPIPAVEHALSAGDVDRAADLVEHAIPEMLRDRQERALCQWVEKVPDETLDRRPVLAMGFVAALMSSNSYAGIERRLRRIEESLSSEPSDRRATDDTTPWLIGDAAQRDRLPAQLDLYRAALAQVDGNPESTISHARAAEAKAPPSDALTRASAAALIGLASWTLGDLEAAHRGYTTAAAGLRRLDHLADVLGCSTILADLELTQGKLRQAEHTYQDALALAEDHNHDHDSRLRGTRDMHTGLAQVALERLDLETARQHLQSADQLGESAGLPRNPYRWRVAMATLREAEGEIDTALSLLTEAQRAYEGDFSPDVQPVAAARARVAARHDRLSVAEEWARQRGLSPDDDLAYPYEYEHVTLAEVLLARHRNTGDEAALSGAATLLQRLLIAAEEGARFGTVIEILVLLALVQQSEGSDEMAIETLRNALELAAPEGHVWAFTSRGSSLLDLLSTMLAAGPSPTYARHLMGLAAVAQPEPSPTSSNAADALRGALVEPLTGRERDVLRLLASDLDGPGIARELVLSLNTVRTHTKNLYAKLGVTNRRAAVTRGHQLKLLA